MPPPRLTLLHGLLLLADNGIREFLWAIRSQLLIPFLSAWSFLLRHWVAFKVVHVLALQF